MVPFIRPILKRKEGGRLPADRPDIEKGRQNAEDLANEEGGVGRERQKATKNNFWGGSYGRD